MFKKILLVSFLLTALPVLSQAQSASAAASGSWANGDLLQVQCYAE